VWDIPQLSVTQNTNDASHYHNQVLFSQGVIPMDVICIRVWNLYVYKPWCTPDLEPWKTNKAQSDIFRVYFELLHCSFRTKDVHYVGLIDTRRRCCIRARIQFPDNGVKHYKHARLVSLNSP
jgi:hypothetical protein